MVCQTVGNFWLILNVLFVEKININKITKIRFFCYNDAFIVICAAHFVFYIK